ncbi:ArsR/SmtB family transcription factor [Mycobacteroides franklinii]|uniref:HTH-type transcriptional regulator CmtR n=1 Tax=Mycobacteroides franklinii TaxID=948102 RepID=A0A4R8R941_9MYCO|nr:metalloregulator ArsR/SmtB family transcription factor [Mycobacteroides franklinii]TDZ42566.1 HTH-type transcriptional regulator CmtR [Mycobacteroides franklinii]TDZ52714.1 HTH-type transcriptional regulator CmtR [Mycobacteroides franklinii]TDZ56121.1 HTH-type transcriptional regulator CmtR [Mycobacteroides franklinii]TDZ63062.1 HTH-type transcriptional regulator CmtR [Mycobacteroides franklinii]TDZ69459.1 HTH-type transcriptional regulator CmtR [Mycobacteroides franklinii]
MTAAIDDDLWAAVGDPTRRRVFDLILTDGMATATTLSDRLPVTRQAVTKHLSVLDKAGLVHATTNGREKQYRANAEQVARIAGQLTAVGAAWDRRLARIKQIAESLHNIEKTE